jgi:hypothetical protein
MVTQTDVKLPLASKRIDVQQVLRVVLVYIQMSFELALSNVHFPWQVLPSAFAHLILKWRHLLDAECNWALADPADDLGFYMISTLFLYCLRKI